MEFDELDLGPDGSNLGISIDEHIGDNIGDDEYANFLKSLESYNVDQSSNIGSILDDSDEGEYDPELNNDLQLSDDDDDDDDSTDDSDTDSDADLEEIESGVVGSKTKSGNEPQPLLPYTASNNNNNVRKPATKTITVKKSKASSSSKKSKEKKSQKLQSEISSLLTEEIQSTFTTSTAPPRIDKYLDSYELPPLSTTQKDSLRPYIAGQTTAPKAITQKQMQVFRNLLAQHHQLLIQTAVISVRRAIGGSEQGGLKHARGNVSEQDQKERALQVVESSASMLEKILECRSTAVRNSLKYKRTRIVPVNVPEEKRRGGDGGEEVLTRSRFRGILGEEQTTGPADPSSATPPPSNQNFSNTNNSNSLNTSSNLSTSAPSRNTDGRTTSFESPAISLTRKTLKLLDWSVDANEARIKPNSALDCADDREAIEKLLAMAGVGCNEGFLPTKDTRSLFNPEIRRDENVDPMRFTKSEDRLLMAGISKYGEKRWDLISSEYLPNKKMEMINRRYCKLTVMACKDRVDAGGALRRMQKNPPRPESDTPDEPYWTFSDDVELYYGVHVKGRQFATLTDIMFPHLDRVILRKRYLNIERRFKTAELKPETDIEPVKAKKAPSAAKKEPNKSPTTAKGRGRGKKNAMLPPAKPTPILPASTPPTGTPTGQKLRPQHMQPPDVAVPSASNDDVAAMMNMMTDQAKIFQSMALSNPMVLQMMMMAQMQAMAGATAGGAGAGGGNGVNPMLGNQMAAMMASMMGGAGAGVGAGASVVDPQGLQTQPQQQQQQQQQRMVPPNPQPTSSTSKAPTVEPVAEVYVADPPEQPTSSKSTKKNASAKTKKKAKKKTKKQIEEEKREEEQAAAKADEETNDPLGLNSSRWGASDIGGHSMFGVTGTSTGFSQLGGVENSFMANLNPIVGGGDQRNGGSAVNPNDTSFKPEKSMFENMLENANRSASNSVRSEQGSSFSSPSKTKNKDQAAAALALAAAATGSPGVGAGLWDGFSNLGSDASNAGGIEFSKLEFSDATQQAFKQGGRSGATPKKRRAGSLNLSDEDVAASGLRSLSTPSPSGSKKKAKKGGEDSPGSKRKSLFSAVIGGSGEKKKRKSSSASL
ncbi:hypothetical protein TrST_g4580 [Triparma strigata]|uniref:Myb-like domain-containing protein n=1 Tax=Triparma strigata TaxID=1606541 RepID=A0A9W7EJV3_9STRA|nr:hypothetical protein TrST_g4580 [Triparma strigata]